MKCHENTMKYKTILCNKIQIQEVGNVPKLWTLVILEFSEKPRTMFTHIKVRGQNLRKVKVVGMHCTMCTTANAFESLWSPGFQNCGKNKICCIKPFFNNKICNRKKYCEICWLCGRREDTERNLGGLSLDRPRYLETTSPKTLALLWVIHLPSFLILIKKHPIQSSESLILYIPFHFLYFTCEGMGKKSL